MTQLLLSAILLLSALQCAADMPIFDQPPARRMRRHNRHLRRAWLPG